MGVQFTIQGGSVFNKGVQYTMDENGPRGQYTMGFKIPYDTGTIVCAHPKTVSGFLLVYFVVFECKLKGKEPCLGIK